MALIETEEAARRLARAISSDLALYNEEKIAEGIRNDNLFDVMAEEIQEGRDLYQTRGRARAPRSQPLRPRDHRPARPLEGPRRIADVVGQRSS